MKEDKLTEEAGNLVGQLNNFADKVNQGIDFSINQAPDVVQQFILWERVRCVLGGLSFVLAVVFIILSAYLYVKIERDKIIHVISAALSFFLFSVAIVNLFPTISAWVAPKWHIVSTLIDKM